MAVELNPVPSVLRSHNSPNVFVLFWFCLRRLGCTQSLQLIRRTMRRIPITISHHTKFSLLALAKEPLFSWPESNGFIVLHVAFLSHVVTAFRQQFFGSFLNVLSPLFPQLSSQCKVAPKMLLKVWRFAGVATFRQSAELIGGIEMAICCDARAEHDSHEVKIFSRNCTLLHIIANS